MTEYRAGSLDDFKETGRLLLKCGEAEIGIFLVDGEFIFIHFILFCSLLYCLYTISLSFRMIQLLNLGSWSLVEAGKLYLATEVCHSLTIHCGTTSAGSMSCTKLLAAARELIERCARRVSDEAVAQI